MNLQVTLETRKLASAGDREQQEDVWRRRTLNNSRCRCKVCDLGPSAIGKALLCMHASVLYSGSVRSGARPHPTSIRVQCLSEQFKIAPHLKKAQPHTQQRWLVGTQQPLAG